MPAVSVIIPNYNHAQFLRRRIESVLRQTYTDFEVILLDDCSTDESHSILSEYANDQRVRVAFNTVNSGSSFKQWNRGVRLAEGRYAWIAESDDYADERFLEKLVPVLDGEPSAVLAYCRSWKVLANGEISGTWPDQNGKRWTANFRADGREECENYLIRGNSIPNASAVLFRREVYEEVGGADENLVLCGDWKLWVAMALKGTIVYLAEPLNYYRFHDASVRQKSQHTGVGPLEYLELIRWMSQRITPSDAARRRLSGDAFAIWNPTVDVLTRTAPELALRVIYQFLALSGPRCVEPSVLANIWLTVAGIHYRQHRPGKAILSAARAVLVRPIVAGRPVKRLLTRLAGSFRKPLLP